MFRSMILFIYVHNGDQTIGSISLTHCNSINTALPLVEDYFSRVEPLLRLSFLLIYKTPSTRRFGLAPAAVLAWPMASTLSPLLARSVKLCHDYVRQHVAGVLEWNFESMYNISLEAFTYVVYLQHLGD